MEGRDAEVAGATILEGHEAVEAIVERGFVRGAVVQPMDSTEPREIRALLLRAEGYSYAEICELTQWTHTKVNRCLTEGRARLRQLGAL